MKKQIFLLVASFFTLFMVGCDEHDNTAADLGLVGEWQLMEWTGNDKLTFDVYLNLKPNGAFELFQKVETSYYVQYNGTYTTTEDQFMGRYDDGQDFGAAYRYSLSATGNVLTLTSEHETQVYARVFMPDYVRPNVKTRAWDAPEPMF